MPSNATWVCFECRQAVRRDNWPFFPKPVKCSHCGGECTSIGHKIPLPSKSDVRAWRSLREQLQNSAVDAQVRKYEQRVRDIHALEQQIADLEARPKNEGRAKSMKHLRSELRALQGRGEV